MCFWWFKNETFFFCVQDEQNQIMITSIWLKQVSPPTTLQKSLSGCFGDLPILSKTKHTCKNKHYSKRLSHEALFTSTLEQTNGRLWNARWQQTYQVNFHCWRSSEPAHITENNVFYLVSLLPPSVSKVSYCSACYRTALVPWVILFFKQCLTIPKNNNFMWAFKYEFVLFLAIAKNWLPHVKLA